MHRLVFRFLEDRSVSYVWLGDAQIVVLLRKDALRLTPTVPRFVVLHHFWLPFFHSFVQSIVTFLFIQGDFVQDSITHFDDYFIVCCALVDADDILFLDKDPVFVFFENQSVNFLIFLKGQSAIEVFIGLGIQFDFDLLLNTYAHECNLFSLIEKLTPYILNVLVDIADLVRLLS